MRIALIVNKVGPDRVRNLEEILFSVEKAASSGAKLIPLPDAVLTGLINNDNPTHDLPLGETVPGVVTKTIGMLCRQYSIWLSIGLLEREGNQLYDTAVLIDDEGYIVLKYRRIQPQWHGKTADPSVYCQGLEIPKCDTPFGSLAFLICGDLFDDKILSQFKVLAPDWIIFPFARCFSDGSINQIRWDTEELPCYVERVKLAGTPALMTSYLSDSNLNDGNTSGGAFVISASGNVIASHSLGEPGILLVDI